MILISHACLLLASKNYEVEPLSLNDVVEHLLGSAISKSDMVRKESEVRLTLDYENEAATLFEFLMFYSKIWKTACQFQSCNFPQDKYSSATRTAIGHHFDYTYDFLGEVEALGYDICKSVLIDAELLEFKPSIIVASVLYTSIDLTLRFGFSL